MVGDWNSMGAEDLRVHMGVEAEGGGDPLARVFDGLFTNFAELWQPYPTFGRRGKGGMSVLSRLDRIYSNGTEVEAVRHFRSVATLGSLHSAEHDCVINAYSDSDWAGCLRTRKYTSGGALCIRSCMVKRRSSTQKAIALSSAEIAMYTAMRVLSHGLRRAPGVCGGQHRG